MIEYVVTYPSDQRLQIYFSLPDDVHFSFDPGDGQFACSSIELGSTLIEFTEQVEVTQFENQYKPPLP